MRIILSIFFLLLCSITTQAQDIYDINKITDIKIIFKESNWNIILDSLKRAGKEDRLTGSVTVNGKKYDQVGIRYKGNSSFKSVSDDGNLKLPFNIKINEVNKKQALPGGYNTLKLSNAFRDPSFVREILAYEIARKYMPAPRANFAKVHVNDQYLGVYHNVESIDDPFLRKHFGNDNGVLVKCDPDWTVEQAPGCVNSDKSSLMYVGEDSTCYLRFYEMKDKNGWKNFINFTKTLNLQPENIEPQLNIDQTLWMLAFNNVLVNLDSYTGLLCHNYYLYRDSLGVYHPLVWDMNMAFGGFRRLNEKGELALEDLQKLSLFVHYSDENPRRPLISKLLKNNLNRKIYLAHVQTILKDYFVNGLYLKRAQALQTLIDPHIKADKQKLYTYEAFQQNLQQTVKADEEDIVGIAQLMKARTDTLSNHPIFQKEAPKITAATHKQNALSLDVTVKAENTQKTWLFYRYGKGTFTKKEMQAGEDNMTYTASIDYKKTAEYYIVAENQHLVKLSPERAAFEFHKVTSVVPTSTKPKTK